MEAQQRGEHSNTAGHHVVAGIPRVRPEVTAEEVRAQLSARPYDCLDLICVIDGADALVGTVTIARLMGAPDGTEIRDLMKAGALAVHPEVDQERVASFALHHVLNAVPVTDMHGHLLGVVPPEALLHILRKEHVEDLHRLAGIGSETARAREAMESPPLRRARHRLPWLLIGLLGSMVATAVVASFEQALESRVMLAFFIPGLVYMADAIGTQSEAVAVRGLSLSHGRIGHWLGSELRTGLIIGVTLGLVTFPAVWLIFGDRALALAVALALVASGAVAATIGMFLPWLLHKSGMDPAYGSGPLATIIQDVLSLLIYFAVATAIVL